MSKESHPHRFISLPAYWVAACSRWVFHRFTGLSAYWFATSLKWFILFFLVPSFVSGLVPGGEKNRWWGLIVAVGAIEAMIGPAFIGWLSDRTRSRWGMRRPYIALGSAMTAVALLAMGQAQSFAGLIISYLLIQISDDIGTGPYSSAIPELVEKQHRGVASGHMGLMQLAGQLMAVVFGLTFGSSPQTILLLAAAINLVCASISIAIVARLERGHFSEKPTAPAQEAFGSKGIWAAFSSRDFLWVWLTRFLNALGFYVILTYLTYFLKDVIKTFDLGFVKFGSEFEAAIALAAVLSLTGAISAVVFGKRADRVGRKRVVKEAGWIMFVPLVLFCAVSQYVWLVPLALLFGVGYGAYLSADWAVVSDVLPDEKSLARDMGLWQMSIAAPQVLSGSIGYLIDQGNAWQSGNGYRIAFLIASVAMLLGSLLIGKVKGST